MTADVRDRLASSPRRRGTSIRALVRSSREHAPDDERRERAERTRAYLAEHFGVEVNGRGQARPMAE